MFKRLSHDGESMSIRRQKQMLKGYIQPPTRFTVEGYSDKNIGRPDFQRSLSNIGAGLIQRGSVYLSIP